MEEFFDSKVPEKYAILSHCWNENEVSYQAFQTLRRKDDRMKKIVACCSLAKSDGCDYAWVDTCCINKDTSTELSEAINSMFQWYAKAYVCYVLLSDMTTVGKPWAEVTTQLLRCRWFRRGWTLQELIAPVDVRFYDADGHDFGTKESLAHEIAKDNAHPSRVLDQAKLVPVRNRSVADELGMRLKHHTNRRPSVCSTRYLRSQYATSIRRRQNGFRASPARYHFSI